MFVAWVHSCFYGALSISSNPPVAAYPVTLPPVVPHVASAL